MSRAPAQGARVRCRACHEALVCTRLAQVGAEGWVLQVECPKGCNSLKVNISNVFDCDGVTGAGPIRAHLALGFYTVEKL